MTIKRKMAATHPTTKSIDVGSMFLMDLSVQESDMTGDIQNADNDIVFPASKTLSSYPLNEKARSKTKINYANLNTSNHQQSPLVINNNHHTSKSIAYHRQENRNDYLGNSLDRLASAIQQLDEDHEQQENIGTIIATSITTKELPTINMGNLVTTVEPLPPLELDNLNPSSTSASSSSLLSDDDSFVATSSGGDSSSLSDSFGADDDEEEDVDVERSSANTREDSGVLDMKNLESQLNNSYDDFRCSNDDLQKQQQLEHKLLHKEKPISTNLINKSANNNNNNISRKRPNKPTKINNKGNHDCSSNSNNNHHHHHRGQTSSKRSILMSASLPIQCPPRQMKRDLGKLKKLDLVDETIVINNDDAQGDQLATGASQQHDNSQISNQVDEIEADDIWEQDYNLNHKNHYPINNYDEENLRADTNPQQLFESIKALAKSLHEDAELFGSLPPKRLLESPIHRSLAFA